VGPAASRGARRVVRRGSDWRRLRLDQEWVLDQIDQEPARDQSTGCLVPAHACRPAAQSPVTSRPVTQHLCSGAQIAVWIAIGSGLSCAQLSRQQRLAPPATKSRVKSPVRRARSAKKTRRRVKPKHTRGFTAAPACPPLGAMLAASRPRSFASAARVAYCTHGQVTQTHAALITSTHRSGEI
jgi:hypothetical protein